MGSGCNIGCKILFSKRGLTCPAGISTCLATLLNKGEIGLRPKHYLPSGASQGVVQLAPLPFFAKFTCNLQRHQWSCCTLGLKMQALDRNSQKDLTGHINAKYLVNWNILCYIHVGITV